MWPTRVLTLLLASSLALAGSACGEGAVSPPGGGGGGGGGNGGGDGNGNGGGSGSVAAEVSGFLGGGDDDQLRDVAMDGAGNLYLTGGTPSSDFPVTSGAFQTEHNPGSPSQSGIDPFDVFVTKLGPDGSMIWSTFIGGGNYERAYAIEVDEQGFVYVAGRAGEGFPVTSGAFQTQFMGGEEAPFYGPQDGFLCKLEPDGSRLVFCSYFGTSDPSIVRDLAVNAAGEVYLAAARSSGSYPSAVEAAFVNGPMGNRDAVVAKVAADGGEVSWARYLGGSAWESNENSVRLTGPGDPVVLLSTESADAETVSGAAFGSLSGNADFYLARLNAASGGLDWATYLGGSGRESTETHELAVTPDGAVVVAGRSDSRDFPTTSGALQTEFGGGSKDVVLARIASDGGSLAAGTYLGGGDTDVAEGVAIDETGRIFFTGHTLSRDFPVTEDALQGQWSGDRDAIAVVVDSNLSDLLYSTYLGGSNEDLGRTATFGPDRFMLGGMSRSSQWPHLGGANGAHSGGHDGIFAVFAVGQSGGSSLSRLGNTPE